MNKIQFAEHKNRVRHENYEFDEVKAMPLDRIPSLDKIVSMFVQGRPLDANLQRHLDYNEFEGNPVFEKGFDLADYSRVARENKATLEELNKEVEQARLKSQTQSVADPSIQEPTQVSTE